ncbi:ADP-ribosylation factor-like protein 11 [Trichomycterus rosablanca]|uniref:ADP-ribosylation factor-like protein 11 n=1 Tax=Trichomycterus rosablanca TaxID=2290929 RepID=UPI002F35986B
MGPSLRKQTHQPPQVILLGLDSAGKSTLLYRLHQGVIMETVPTIGFNIVNLKLDKKSVLTVWDVGGHESMRSNWKYYLEGCKALVYVVDASDHSRINEAKMALNIILSDHNLKDVPLMVLANKTDMQNSMTINDVSSGLDLKSCTNRDWEIQACSALQGLGLHQAFQSVAKMITKK